MMMPVDISQWRVTIGCFSVSMQKFSPVSKSVRLLSLVVQIFKLYWFCLFFVALAVIALPFTLTIQFLAVHSVPTQSCFLPLFARVHHFVKKILYVSVELVERIPLGIVVAVRYKYFNLSMPIFTLHAWNNAHFIQLG